MFRPVSVVTTESRRGSIVQYFIRSLSSLQLALNRQGDFDAALTFDACSVSLCQLNFALVVELTFAAILEV
jgi:hypothetical protein